MINRLTTKREIIKGFANAMNLINPEVQHHHHQVAYLAYQLADVMGLSDDLKQKALYGGLVHDIGGALDKENVSLMNLEENAKDSAVIGSTILKLFPETRPFAGIVKASQTPWDTLKRAADSFRTPYLISQIVHLADVVSLLLNDSDAVLNQVEQIRTMLHEGGSSEFSPEVMKGFDKLCGLEIVWLNTVYHPETFLDLIVDDSWLTVDETIRFTEFMSKIVDFRSPFTAMHSAGVAATAVALARLYDMSEDECKLMQIAGNLHDIGKLRVPTSILEKPGKLTDSEFNVMKEHAYYSWLLLKDIKGFDLIAQWAALHHEKLNGAGYPFHHKKEDLPLGSRIMTVADIFSAITEDRPYRKSMDKEKVISILRTDAERGLLSPDIVEMLISHYDEINHQRDIASKKASKKYQQSLAESRKKQKEE